MVSSPNAHALWANSEATSAGEHIARKRPAQNLPTVLPPSGIGVTIAWQRHLEEYLTAYLEQTGILTDDKGPLFRTIGRGTDKLTRTPLPQANAYAMIRRRALAAGIGTKVGNHSFRATGITAYLKNGGTLEKAAQMANHASTRTTQLYDRRRDEMSLDEVERIRV